MSVSEKLKEEGRKIAVLECILALMENTGWDVEHVMDVFDLPEDERDLYRHSVQYALEQKTQLWTENLMSISTILTIHNNFGMSQDLQDMMDKIGMDVDLKQMLVLARPGETVYGLNPNSTSKNDKWKVVGIGIEEGTWYRLEDESGHGWNIDTEKFLKYLRKESPGCN